MLLKKQTFPHLSLLIMMKKEDCNPPYNGGQKNCFSHLQKAPIPATTVHTPPLKQKLGSMSH